MKRTSKYETAETRAKYIFWEGTRTEGRYIVPSLKEEVLIKSFTP